MLVHPQFNPVALELGPLQVHWYGLMYLLAFLQFWWLGKKRMASHAEFGLDEKALDDLMFWGVLGVIVGGRLGQVLFYEPAYYFNHPVEILKVWKGGMSFHGGFLGVLLAMTWFAHRRNMRWLSITDFIAPLVPLGLMFGRIGNFINGELWGRVADPELPWGMVFPQVMDGAVPRHPSQIYQALGEGLLLFIILWLYAKKTRPTGAVSAVFLIGYGAFRFIAEYFREPDHGIFGISTVVSMGQWLSLPMIIAGVLLFAWTQRKKV